MGIQMRIVIQHSPAGVESDGAALESELLEAVRLLDRNRVRTASASVFQESMVIVLERENDSDQAIETLMEAGFRVSSF
jgi:hypothetical protein